MLISHIFAPGRPIPAFLAYRRIVGFRRPQPDSRGRIFECVCAALGPARISDLAPRSLIPAEAYIRESPQGDDQAEEKKNNDHEDLDHEQGNDNHLEVCVVLFWSVEVDCMLVWQLGGRALCGSLLT